MSTFEKAVEIAARAHAGVKDKQGKAYLLHPIRVMLGVADETAQIVAILHDVVEDTSVSMDDVRAAGFSVMVTDALELVTHREDQTYAEYVIACKTNPISRQVKLSDLRDNASLERSLLRAERFDSDTARIQRYALSYQFLTDQIDEATYREMMAKSR
jgi:(p)ppGpp synthase/HD superfamily hydrolase